ncbi:MAG: RidA family protein [Candidatus Bathyarchaeota archaeon]|nr:RidA family protein [Candidatus Bathyarchaeota archaeon]
MKVEHVNPEALRKPRGYTQVVAVSGPHKTIYIGEQDAVNEKGETVGKGNLKLQTAQVLSNLERALEAVDAKLENVVKWTVYIVAGQNPQEGFGVFSEKWQNKQNPPAITVVFVAALGNPEWLVEIEAVAVIPE